MNHQPLSWGLVIATYKREKILPQCLKLAIEQTRPPQEIIVVDASDDWQSTRRKVLSDIAATAPHIRWIYTSADQRGSTLQRNQGIQLATADVVFLIDDDSLMYPDCAAEIMRVYEADPEKVIQGVQAKLVDEPPSPMAIEDAKKQTGLSEQQVNRFGAMQSFLWKHLFLMNAELLHLPYEGEFPEHEIPDAVAALNIYPVKLFHGCRMTFRRKAIAEELFEPSLQYYAATEDLDASYRVSRKGALVEACEAKLHHFQSGSGRLSRSQVATLSALNQALCLKKHSNDLERDRSRYYRLTARRVLAEVLKDGLSRRWSLPQARGLLAAWRHSRDLFDVPNAELADWYSSFQQAFLTGDRSGLPKPSGAVLPQKQTAQKES